MTDSDASREASDPEAAPEEESSPVVERRWRPADDAPFHVPASSEAEAPADASAPPPDAPPGDGDPASNPHDQASSDSSGERAPPTDDGQSGPASPEEKATGGASSPDPSPTASDAAPKEVSRSRDGHGGGEPEGPEPARTGASGETSLDTNDPDRTLPPQAPPADAADEAARQGNEDALMDSDSDGSWIDRVRDRPEVSLEPEEDDEGNFFTDNNRYVPGAERVEEELQEFAYEINEGTANTDWTPSERADRRIASMFGRLVSKVAEDMSYQPVPGDEFWDPRKIMRRQIDRRPLQHCKMDYTKQRLALLVDTSPSCRDEAVFYSKIATGALLRDDIDIFLCPNGHIDAKFDPDPMRFVEDDRGSTWGLEGRVVLYFTDWDGTDEIVDHSRDCTLYWFDNCSPSTYWESEKDRHRRVRLQYRGRHFYCPDPEAFRRLARKIRP